MVGRLISSALKLRVAFWVAEQLLPSGVDVKHRFKSGLLGIAAATAGGVLSAFAVAGLLVTGGFFLSQYGEINLVSVLVIMFAIIALLIVGIYTYVKYLLDQMFKPSRRRRTYKMIKREQDNYFRAMVNGFIEGLTTSGQRHDSPPSVPTKLRFEPKKAA